MSQAPTNIATYFYDASSIAISFSDASLNTYFNSSQPYYYLASAVDTSGNKTTYATGTKSPILIQGLSAGYTYTCKVYTVQTASSDLLSFTTLSFPTVNALSLANITGNSIDVSWNGSDISYVKVTRKVATAAYVDICGSDYNTPYTDTDISGNTVYYYYVTPYMTKYGPTTVGTASSVLTTTTPGQAATGLTTAFVDTSAIQISFTAPKNSYVSSYYYQLNAVYSGTTTSASGATTALQVSGLLDGTSYSCYILTYLDGTLGATSSAYVVSTISKTLYTYYLLVGGGGGGGGVTAGGGGAGGVVYMSIGITDFSSNQGYAVIVGSGGTGGSSAGGSGTNGQDSKLIGPSLVSTAIIASGGGGGNGSGQAGLSGGSGGGGGTTSGTGWAGGSSTQSTYTGHTVYGNAGGTSGTGGNQTAGGGGGAGAVGGTGTSSVAGSGGAGVAIDITGLSTYYAGGGGGSYYVSGGTNGTGGSGIGGSGAFQSTGGNGVVNTGSGGGGGGNNSAGGNGGSGLVVLKIPTTNLGSYWGSPIVSTSGTYTILKFISSGVYQHTKGLSNSFTNYSFATLSTAFDTTSTSDICTYSSYTGQYMYSCAYTSSTIYRSSNYGVTWSSSTVAAGGMIGICCSWDGSIVYTCGNGNGYIYKSTNYGASFTQVKSGLSVDVRPICCSSDGVYVYVASYTGAFYYSTDSGATWTTSAGANSTNFIGLSCSYDGKYLIAGKYQGNTFYLNNSTLTNAGGAWTDSGKASSQGSVAISQNGTYMLTNNGTSWVLSKDGGSSWSTLPYPVNGTSILSACAMSYTGQYMIVGYNAGSGGGIYYSCDYGTSWALIPNSTVYTATQGSSTRTNMSISASGAYALANNGSKTTYFIMKAAVNQYTSMTCYTLPTFDTTSAGDWDTACSYTGQYLYSCGGATTMYRSSNYGSTWSSTVIAYIMYGICCSWDGRIVYTAGTGYIYKSTDYGVSFTQVKSGLDAGLRPICCSSDGVYVYAASMNSSFYYSSDSGVTWSTSAGTNSTGFLGLKCSYDGKYLIAAKWNGNAFYLNNSTLTNAGGAWTSTGVSGSSTTCAVAISENGTYMLANNNTTSWQISKNGGASWTTLPSPVSSTGVIVGSAMSYTGQYMIVGYNNGSGGGIYYSNDYGTTWGLIPGSTAYTSSGGSSTRNFSMSPSGAYAMANGGSKSSYLLMVAGTTNLIGSETYYYRFENFDLSTYTLSDYSSGYQNASSKAATIANYSGTTYATISSSYFAVGNSSIQLTSANTNYISLPNHTISSTTGYSMSFWANAFTLTTNYYETLFHFSGTSSYGVRVQSITGSYFAVTSVSSGGSSVVNISTTYWPMTTYAWYHISLVFSYLSSTTATLYIYINNVLSNSGGTTVYFPFGDTISTYYVGRQTNYDAKTFWNGCIDDFRIFNGTALTAANVSTLYGYGNDIYKDAIMRLDATNSLSYKSGSTIWSDLTGNANNITLTSTTYSSSNGGCIVFDGSTSFGYLSTVNNFVGTNVITLFMWVYINSYNVQSGTTFDVTNANILFSLHRIAGADVSKQFVLTPNKAMENDTSAIGLTTTTNPSTGAWVLIGYVKNGAILTMYLNGSANGTTTATTTNVYQNTDLCIGKNYRDNINNVSAKYSSIVMYNSVFSSAQVLAYYNATKTNFGY